MNERTPTTAVAPASDAPPAAPQALDPLGLKHRTRTFGWNSGRIFVGAVTFPMATVASIYLATAARSPRPSTLALTSILALGAFLWMVYEFRRRHGFVPSRPPRRVLRRRVVALNAVFVVGGIAAFSLLWAWIITRQGSLLPVALAGIAGTMALHAWLRYERRRLHISWTEPVRLRHTAFGAFHLLLTFALGLVALQTGLNLLIGIFAVMLTLIVVSGIVTSTNFARLRVSRAMPAEIVAGERTPVRARLRNGKRWLPSYSLWLQEGWPVGVAEPDLLPSAYALRVPPRGSTTLTYDVVFPQRGVFRFVGFTIMTRFPFSMFARYTHLTHEREVVVFPPIGAVPQGLLPAAVQSSAASHQQAAALGTGDVRGLRPYVMGIDDVKAIHWRTSARLGQPMVRERERETTGARWVVLERGDVGLSFERAIGLAATLIHDAWMHGVAFTLVVPPMAPIGPPSSNMAHRRACLRELARLRGYRPADYVDPPDVERLPETARPLPEADRRDDASAMAAGPATIWSLPPGSAAIALATTPGDRFASYVAAAVPRASRLVLVCLDDMPLPPTYAQATPAGGVGPVGKTPARGRTA